jgi:hypothetical protein
MIQKPNTRAFLFDDISDFCKPALKHKAANKRWLPSALEVFAEGISTHV